jgi:hypothetical protein
VIVHTVAPVALAEVRGELSRVRVVEQHVGVDDEAGGERAGRQDLAGRQRVDLRAFQDGDDRRVDLLEPGEQLVDAGGGRRRVMVTCAR